MNVGIRCQDVCREPVITNGCNHSYCASCIYHSIEIEPFCPLCRSRIKIEGASPYVQQRSSRERKTDGLMLFNIGTYTTPPHCANVLTQSSLLPVHTIRSASELSAVGIDLGAARVLLQQEVWLPTDCSSGCATWTCSLLLVCALYLSQQGPRLSLQRYASSFAPLYYFSINPRYNPNEP